MRKAQEHEEEAEVLQGAMHANHRIFPRQFWGSCAFSQY